VDGRRFAGSLGGQLLTGSLSSGRLADGLLSKGNIIFFNVEHDKKITFSHANFFCTQEQTNSDAKKFQNEVT